MKKVIFVILILMLVPMVFSKSVILAYDDFNRPDNQNVSQGYEGGFIYYEEPLYTLDNQTQYNGADEVMIKDGKLYLEERDYCDATTLLVRFDNLQNMTTFEDGNISFKWTSGDNAQSIRWSNYIVFGYNLFNTPSFSEFCSGQGYHNKWWVTGSINQNKKIFNRIFIDRSEGINRLRFLGNNCGSKSIDLFGIGNNTFHNFAISFDIVRNIMRINIDGEYEEDINCNFQEAETINSIAFETYTNQGDAIPYSIIDDLTITKEVDEPEEPESYFYLLEEFSPVFYLHSSEKYNPKDIMSMLDYSDLYKSSQLIQNAPTSIQDITDLDESKKHFLDMNNVDTSKLHKLPKPIDFLNYSYKVYGTATEDENGYIHLQYFMFYPFQKYMIMNHEGDWEMVQVTLDPSLEISSVSYFFNYLTNTYYKTDLIEFINQTHPVVYVSKGNHNNYANTENISFAFVPKGFKFFNKLLNNFKKLDKLNDNGLKLLPNGFDVEEKQENYELEEITGATPWINYEGLWGQKTVSSLRSGPKGPKYNPRFSDKWNHPDEYTYAPQIPFVASFLYSPLDMKITDSSGNELDYDFYTGPRNEPEVIMTSGLNDYILNLDATRKGKFSLEVFFYDNVTDSGIMVSYNNIKNSKKSKAKLDVNKESTYALYFDYDGDNNYESIYRPDEFVTYNDYVILDTDDDGINDFLDNCPFISNLNQEDFNDNNKGDICDNPRYYKKIALEQILNSHIKKEKQFVIKQVNLSLSTNYWENDFEVNSIKVFLHELAASKFLRNEDELARNLALADKLLLQKKLMESNFDAKKGKYKDKRSRKYYELGNKEFDKQKYSKAIFFYLKGWMIA